MPNPVVHFEIHSSNAKSLNKYYADLFGWHVNTDNEMGYGMVETYAGKGIDGGISPQMGDEPNMVLFYVESDDLQASLDKAMELGGKVFMPVTEMPMVTFAMFADPKGNVIGLVKSESGYSE
jgi:predicted enzyme related to lactoylglutathione lyase